jgi:hypothetical protein
MKKQMFALLVLSLMLATVSAYGQSVLVKANIPFEFSVTGATLPAGAYTIQSLTAEGMVLSIRDSDMKAQEMVLAIECESRNDAQQSKLVFHRYGDRYFLAQVWVAGRNLGHRIPKSPRETEVAKDYTMPEVVLVAALR